MSNVLNEVLAKNSEYVGAFGEKGSLAMPPKRRFSILTCMDARLDPAKFDTSGENFELTERSHKGLITSLDCWWWREGERRVDVEFDLRFWFQRRIYSALSLPLELVSAGVEIDRQPVGYSGHHGALSAEIDPLDDPLRRVL